MTKAESEILARIKTGKFTYDGSPCVIKAGKYYIWISNGAFGITWGYSHLDAYRQYSPSWWTREKMSFAYQKAKKHYSIRTTDTQYNREYKKRIKAIQAIQSQPTKVYRNE